jgi:LacI family transcriptional regulator
MDTILFFTDLLARSRVYQYAGAQEVLANAGKRLEGIEYVRLTETISDVMDFWKPQGVIIEGSGGFHIPPRLLKGIPVVFLDPPNDVLSDPASTTVLNDGEAIADLAYQELVDCGATSFAFLGWAPDIGWSHRRQARFAARAKADGKPCFALKDDLTFGNKTEFAQNLRAFLATLPKGCGLFAVNDAYASDALTVCAAAGYSVPGDFALVGVDDDPGFCDALQPSLTSVRPGFRTSGRRAAELLLRRIADPARPPEKVVYVPLGVTRRLSTRTLKIRDAAIAAALDYIRREACNGLRASDVVAFLRLSERVAEKHFMSATGRSIRDEIIDVRMERVFELLKRPNQAIEPIANLCGWGSSIYLKRLFKSRTGLTMSEWRNRVEARAETSRGAAGARESAGGSTDRA